jgi:hypothetical protein
MWRLKYPLLLGGATRLMERSEQLVVLQKCFETLDWCQMILGRLQRFAGFFREFGSSCGNASSNKTGDEGTRFFGIATGL